MGRRSTGQQKALRVRRNKELDKVHSRAPGFACQGSIGRFIDFYIRGEVLARKLQSYHRSDEGKSDLELVQINVLKSALRAFGLKFTEQEVKTLFAGGTGKRGSKSARQLRNGYLHTLSDADCQEISNKATKYTKLLEKFLSLRL